MSHKTYKFRLYPTTEQKEIFAKTFGCVRKVYNLMLEDKKLYYEAEGKMLKCSPAEYKEMYPYLKEVDSLALANAQLHLKAAYKNFFEKRSGFPKFKSKRHKQSYTTNLVGGNIKLLHHGIKLPKIEDTVRMKAHREIPDHYRLKSVTVSKSASGKYYASILFEYEDQVPEVEAKEFIGLDFAMHGLYVSSEGDHFDFPRFYRESEHRLKIAQRKLSHLTRGSKNYEKQRVRLAKLHERIAGQRRDMLHKESKRLADTYDAVCIEDLDMQGMSQSLNFGKSVHDNSWGMFTRFLGYKL